MTLKKPKARSITRLKKRLDALFSQYIRYSAIEKDGLVSCYTCPYRAEAKLLQNGHFVPRQYLSLRYEEVNCHPQCYACNQLYNGQPSAYAERLERDYGAGTVASLERRRHQVIPYFPYEEMIEVYKAKVKALDVV